MKAIAVLVSVDEGKGFGIDESDLHRIIHPRYVSNKKYVAPETIGAILLNPFLFDSDESFFFRSLERVAHRKGLEVRVSKYEDEKLCATDWDALKL